MRVRPGVVEGGEGARQTAPGFEAASTAARKRKAENSVNGKLAAMAEAVAQLVTAQKQPAKSQKVFLEINKAVLDRNKALLDSNQAMMGTIKAQCEKSKALNR